MIWVRLFIATVATAAIGWSVAVVPTLWSESAVAEVAAHIAAGETYKQDVLDALAVKLDGRKPGALRAADARGVAIIRLRLAEDALGRGDREAIDAGLDSLAQATDGSIADAPADPYLWMVRFWLDNMRTGLAPEHLRDLRMSYALGPNEAWIAVRRNRLAMAIFSALPTDLAGAALDEFKDLVRSGLYADAVDILVKTAWPIHDLVLERLKDLDESDRRTFARLLDAQDVGDVAVPGIAPPPPRPWR